MIKYLFFILVTLLSGCTADFSGWEQPEEPVRIRFSSRVSVSADVEEATRSGYTTPGQSVGILGMATYEDRMNETTLDGCDAASLHQWMANDVYSLEGKEIVHTADQCPLFPIDKGSAIVAYAYMPHTERIVYGGDDCYIPIDLMADSAATDWMYSGRTAKSKAAYREDETFAFEFKHAMTRLDLNIAPQINKFNKSVRILEIDLGIGSHGKGRLLLERGKVMMDTASYDPGSVHHLLRRINCDFSIYDVTQRTETFYLMPYTPIHDLRIVGLWNDQDTITYEYVIADSAQWNSDNLLPGARSIINVNSIKYNK